MKDFSHLIGLKYEDVNCWEAVRRFYKDVFNIELKNYLVDDPSNKELVNKIIGTDKGEFMKVDEPEFGDIILMKIRGIESHIGVYIGDGRLLHSSQGIGCVTDSITRWENLITGYYRIWEK